MPVPLLDLVRQHRALQADIEGAVLDVLRSGRYILGPVVEELERELAAYLGARHVVGYSSGTDALLAPLMDLGVGPGDQVAMPVYSFFATAGVVARLGAEPLFVDVEPEHLNLDPRALGRALAGSRRVKAVIMVHLFGAAADMRGIMAAANGLPVIEDACQAIGTRHDGRMAGTTGLVGCFSTFPSKNLGGAGDGGFLCTDDEGFATRMRQSRNHGQTAAYEHAFVGGNFRLDALQAAVLRVKLRHLERFIELRRRNAARYRELFAAAGLLDEVIPPADQPDRHAYHQYVIRLRTRDRDRVAERLQAAGVGHAVYYRLPLHLQPCFAEVGCRPGDFPVAERAAATSLALPIFPELTDAEAEEVVAALAAAVAG
jgi:dTDP-4-amino-4,6-dideoxygalactose transaminase